MTIPENLKRIRKEKELTQKKLGELCGMSEVMIRQYELGYRKPKFETLEKIAKALDCKISDIDERFIASYTIKTKQVIKNERAEELIKRRDSGEIISEEEQQEIYDYIEYKKRWGPQSANQKR